MASDSERWARRRGQPSSRGEVYFFQTRQELVQRFRAIPDEERGPLLNAQPSARYGTVDDQYSAPPSGIVALARIIGGLFSREPPPPYMVVLVEQEPLARSVFMGGCLVRRATTLTPPDDMQELQVVNPPRAPRQVRYDPAGYLGTGRFDASRYLGQARSSAAGLVLDASSSIGVAVSERAHHAAVIRRPPPEQGECCHAVYIRPLGGDLRLQDWQLLPEDVARRYLGE